MKPRQKKILRQAKYSINNGKNIIFLPEKERGHIIHGLPVHNGPHKKYNKAVTKDAKKIKKSIQKAVKKAKECNLNPASKKNR